VQALGPAGFGAYNFSSAIDSQFLALLQQEIAQQVTTQENWSNPGGAFVNGRQVLVVQNHDVFALKLNGQVPGVDLAPLEQVPLMIALTRAIEALVQSLGSQGLPNLNSWQADETSYHQYYKPDGLTPHMDNARFPGVIAIAAIFGTSTFAVYDRKPTAYGWDEELRQEVATEWSIKSRYSIPTKPGDLLLMRGTKLYEGMTLGERPEHAVEDATPGRVSMMVRDNSRPSDTNYGFKYLNWDQTQVPQTGQGKADS
jgi:hypothetical protein